MDSLETQLIKLMLYLERYNPKALITIEDNLLTAQKNILSYISTTQNQRAIRKFIKDELNTAFGTFDNDMLEDIEVVSGVSYDRVGAIMTAGLVTDTLAKSFKGWKGIDTKVKDKLLSPNRLILGNNIDDLKNQMILGANQKLRSTILDGFNNNVGIDTINKDVKVILGNLSRNQARTVTRTVLLNAVEESKNEAFTYFEDEIDYWVYSSVLDTRTSPYCWNANGYKTKDISKAKYRPKTHYNCRSMWTIENEFTRALDKEEKNRNLVQFDGRTVNHRDGTKSTKFSVGSVKQIPKTVKSTDAFKYLNDEYAKTYLGATRYKLYKDGKATFREMIDISKNRLLPISEILERI